MKKLLFAAYSLNVGGIETSLVALLNYLSSLQKYKITLVLEKKEGIFLDEIDNKIKVIEYNPNNSSNIIIRKVINFLKRVKFIVKYKNKFNFSACFTTYSISSSFCSRVASKNSALWGHADYMSLFINNKEQFTQFFKNIKYQKFKHIIFVSEEGKTSFLDVFPEMKDKTESINNIINYEKIIDKSGEKIDLKYDGEIKTFLNVGRHDEKQKRLTRILEASNRLHKEGFKFRVLFVGDGQDTSMYKDLVDEYNLQNIILFLGKKKNPYPYFKISDCTILSSDYEGYPVVFNESKVLGIPIITTNVSDSKEEIENKGYGMVVKKETESIYFAMRHFIDKGYKIKQEFNAKEYNNNILNKLQTKIENM